MAEFREVVNNETTTNQEGRESVERVIRSMQEPDADTIAAVLRPETADPQPSSSGSMIPREGQALQRMGRPRKIQIGGKCPRSEYRGKEKPIAKCTKLATKATEEYQKEVDELEELCGLIPDDEYI